MNNVLNQSGKVLEEALAGSNSDDVETTFRGQRNLKWLSPFSQILEKRLGIPLSLCHIQYRVLQMTQ